MLLSLLLACGTTPLPGACDDLPPTSAGACFGSPGLVYEGYGTAELSVTGTVTGLDTGAFPEGCDIRFGTGEQSGTRLVVEDIEGVPTTVGFTVGTGAVAVGDEVSLDLSYTFGEFGPDVAHAVLADAEGVEQVVVGTAGTLDDLRVPDGVTVDEGVAICTEADDCGTWSAFDLLVKVGEASGTVSYGESASIGPWTVVHGGLERQAPSGGSTCPDWFVAHASVGFVRED